MGRFERSSEDVSGDDELWHMPLSQRVSIKSRAPSAR